MGRALALAERGLGFTSPNPCVGAVLVKGERLLGEGYHQKAGGAHAEVAAVEDAHRRGHRLTGATLYVTLEPCCTTGRTPPCTELIIREKIARVVVATTDVNPLHAGRSYRQLRQHGITVTTGVLRTEARHLNRAFNHWILTGHPWVLAKSALSFEGSIATQAGDPRWITGPLARRKAHQLRGEADAIMIGAETARQDDPALTVRLAHYRKKRQPWRVIMTRSGRLPATLKLFTDRHRERTLVYRGVPLPEVLRELGSKGVIHVLIEGGGQLLGEALAKGLVNEVAFFWAPLFVGTQHPPVLTAQPWPRLALPHPHYEQLGRDMLCRSVITL
jgi:diaminohydroxyphosphoribosylaminopyrimidine deaminase / 5-amino-6-(5-phosphoribosylamino)uracil reductase